jgi:xanthine/uracil permease
MTIDQARSFLISSSLLITGCQIVFLLVAPAINYPLMYPKNINMLQIITPVFVGYLGAATHFIFKSPVPQVEANKQFLRPLVVGPIIIYVLAFVAAFGTFGYTNRSGAPIPGGMSVDNLTTALSIILSILAATTGVLISYLFAVDQTQAPPRPRPPQVP